MKASQFQFYLGQYESQSIASLIISHETGFSTIQEALESLARAVIGDLNEENEDKKEVLICPHCKGSIVTAEPPEIDAGQIFSDFFQSDIDTDAGNADLYQKLSEAGWLLDNAHDPKKLIQVFYTDDLLSGILTGDHGHKLEHCIVAPKGIKIYNS